MNAKPINLLLFEDSPDMARLIRRLLQAVRDTRYDVADVGTLADGLEHLRASQADVVLLDLNLPDSAGLETLNRVVAQVPAMPIVVLTSTDDETVALQAVRQGAQDYLIKGQTDNELLSRALRYAIERKIAEETLSESEDRYRDLVQHSQDLISTHDLTGRLLSVNPWTVQTLGYPEADLLQMHVQDVLAPHVRHLFQAYLAEIRERGVAQGTMIVQTRAGEKRIWEYNNTLRTQGVAQPIVRGMARDVTETRRAADAAKQAERRYRSLFEEAPVMYIITQGQETVPIIADCNELFLSTLGYTRAEIIGQPLTNVYEADSRTQLLEGGHQRALNGQFAAEERKLVTRDGRIIDTLLRAMPETDGQGRVTGTRAMYVDITERKRADQALQQSEMEMRAVFAAMRDIVLVIDHEGIYRKIAPTNPSWLYRPPAELLGKSLQDVFPPDQALEFLHATQQVLATGQIRYIEYEMLIGDQRMWFAASITRMTQDLSVWVARDITERKRAEEALQETSELLETVFSNTHLMLAYLDRDFNFVRVNRAYAAADSRAPDFFPGKNHFALYPNAENQAIFQAVVDSGEPYFAYAKPFEYAEHPERGTSYWDWSLTPIKDAAGRVSHLIFGLVNVTERKRAESQIALQAIALESTANAVLITDRDGIIQYVNPAFTTLTGYTVEEALGQNPRLLKSGKHGEVFFKNLWDTILAGQVWRDEVVNRRKDSRLFTVEQVITPVRGEGGKITRFVAILLDVTERKQRERERDLLDRVRTVLAREVDLPTTLRTVVEAIVETFGYTLVSLYLRRGETLVLQHQVGYSQVINEIPITQGILGRVVRTKQPVLLEDVRTDPEFLGAIEGIVSEVCVPLFDQGQVVGGLNVESTQGIQLSKADLNLMTALGEHVSFAITRTRLFDETRRRAGEFAALYETSTALSAVYGLDALLQLIVERAVALLHASAGGMYLYDPAGEELKTVVATDPSIPIGTCLHIGEGVAGRVAQTRQPIQVDDYSNWEGRSPKYEGSPIRAVLEVPMLYGGELVGVLVTEEMGASERKFSQADERLLSLFASQAAAVVHNTRLFAETRERAEQLALLYDAGLAMNSELDPRVQLEFLSQIVLKSLRADRVGFFRYDPQRQDLLFEFGVGQNLPRQALAEIRFSLGEERGLVGWVAQHRQPFNMPDTAQEPRWIALDSEIRSSLWVPVVHEDKLRGVLNVSSKQVNAFLLQDERLLTLFANQFAVAMENARLFEETQRQLAELQVMNKISTALRAAQTLNEMLPIFIDETLAMLGANTGGILLCQSPSNQLEWVISRGWLTELEKLPRKPGEGIAGHVFETGAVYLSREFSSDPYIRESARAKVPMDWGGAGIPILAGPQIIGVLLVCMQHPRELAPAQVHLLTTLAEMAGNAIHRMHLHEQTERSVDRLAALRTIDMAISNSLDVRVTLDVLLEQVTRQLGIDAASILLLNSHTQMLETVAGRGFRTRGIAPIRLRLGEGYAGRAVLDRQMVEVHDWRLDGAQASTPLEARIFQTEGFVSYGGLPLIAKGRVKGVLEIFHRTVLLHDDEWSSLLQAFAGQAAIAIDNAALFDGLQRSNDELALAYDTTLEGWSHALDLRDRETEGHTQRVTEMTTQLARAMGMSDAERVHVRRGALLHDIGKLGVPDSILHKPGVLTDDEWKIMRQHPQLAFDMLAPITYLHRALDIPYCHHEKWDGTGYPRGLKGEQIPLAARLFALVDVWDAVTSDRPYRRAWTRDQARDHIRSQAGKHFDPQLIQVFFDLPETRD